MIKKALYVSLIAKEGKEADVEQFLKNGLSLVQAEPKTISWYALKMGPNHFGIFDTFEDETGREDHLSGEVAKALMAQASELLSEDPRIEKVEILAVKNR